jgi:hypothetical protein
LGDYSLRINPAAARGTINTTIMQNVPTLLTVLMAIAMRRYYTVSITRPMEEVHGFHKSH